MAAHALLSGNGGMVHPEHLGLRTKGCVRKFIGQALGKASRRHEDDVHSCTCLVSRLPLIRRIGVSKKAQASGCGCPTLHVAAVEEEALAYIRGQCGIPLADLGCSKLKPLRWVSQPEYLKPQRGGGKVPSGAFRGWTA